MCFIATLYTLRVLSVTSVVCSVCVRGEGGSKNEKLVDVYVITILGLGIKF